MKAGRLTWIVTWCVLIFFYLPIIVLILQSFNESKYGGSWQGFTVSWYYKAFNDREIHRALENTVKVAIVSTVISTVLGTLAAWALHRFKNSTLQQAHYLALYAPLVVPEVLMGMSLLVFFVNIGMPLGLGTIMISHITFCLSYVCFTVMARLQDFDDTLIHAARDLGAGHWQVVRHVIIPVLGPGILAGAMMAFTLSIDDFVITFFVSGSGSTTLPVYIYSAIKKGSLATINALSVLLMTITFIVVIVTQRSMLKRL